jgi:hypothetical protein
VKRFCNLYHVHKGQRNVSRFACEAMKMNGFEDTDLNKIIIFNDVLQRYVAYKIWKAMNYSKLVQDSVKANNSI